MSLVFVLFKRVEVLLNYLLLLRKGIFSSLFALNVLSEKSHIFVLRQNTNARACTEVQKKIRGI